MTIEERQKYINDLQSKFKRYELDNMLKQSKISTRIDIMNTGINIVSNIITIPLITGAITGQEKR